VDPLTLTIILYFFKSLHQYHISKLSSTYFLLLSIFLFIVYTVNLPVLRPRSCRVIYYFDTPPLGRRHQSFDRVMHHYQRDGHDLYSAIYTTIQGMGLIFIVLYAPLSKE
jgi:hypothetical protein